MMLKATYILLVLLALTACGTKGPLYIPEQRYPEGVPKEPDKGVENNATKKDALEASIHEPSRASS